MEKAGRILGAVSGLGIVGFWIALSLHPNSGGSRYILIASSMIVASLVGVLGAIIGRPGLLAAAFAVSLPSAVYFLLVASIYRAIGFLTPLLLVAALMIHASRRRLAPNP